MEPIYPLFTTGMIDNNLNLFYGLFIGISFGFIIERAGYGRSINIAPIMYFRNTKVSDMMISAILTIATWIIIASYFGLIDYNQLYIPTTYLWPYLLGGALFGLGMVMSGWCPGTAMVGFSTGKLDAAAFLLGVMVGMYSYFINFDAIAEFANSTNVGRYTLHEALGGDIYSSYLITVVLCLGLIFFMRYMKKVRDNKGEDI
jgi:uncharacterized membrane protein YedE/YeeE